MEENAEEMCEKSLSTALNYDHDNLDALLQMSNLRILRKRDEEALEYMEKIYTKIMNSLQNQLEDLPSNDIILNLSKNYSEIGNNLTKAIKLLDILVKLDDEDLESWYLLAYNHYNLKNYKFSFKCLENFNLAADKISHKTDEVSQFEQAAGELKFVLEKIKSANPSGKLKNNNLEESENNDEESMNNNSCDEMTID
jgi:tetratricopeptide (TPR) repeat protein